MEKVKQRKRDNKTLYQTVKTLFLEVTTALPEMEMTSVLTGFDNDTLKIMFGFIQNTRSINVSILKKEKVLVMKVVYIF